ncbi:MAG: hypothetical protein NTW60_01870 [Candidatus Wolfebacteria bacterium]|nr:hypothetical protein [Candidatus Wolfebacteria bacterium]
MTTLIKNVQLIDGAGKPAFKADILIKGKIISAIGSLSKYRADTTIDGMGAYLSPGFIDIHGTSDRYLTLFKKDEQNNLLRQGVTTIIGGQDGLSLAPLIYGSLDLLHDWADVRKINVNWHTISEFLKVLSGKKMALNFGTMVGYKTIEHSIKGDSERAMSGNEIKVFLHILERALREGAFGLSIGSDYFGVSKTGFYDLKNILKIVAKHKTLFSFELSGDGEEKLSSLKKFTSLIEEAGTRSCVSHAEPILGFESVQEKILAEIGNVSARADLFFETCPANSTIFPVCAILPKELFIKEENEKINTERILDVLENNKKREEIRKKLPKLKLNDIRIISVPEHSYLEGKLLKDYGKNRGLTLTQALVHLIQSTRGRAVISYKNIDPKANLLQAANDRTVISSALGHSKIGKEHSFLKFLQAAERSKIMPIEIGVRKLTALPAARLGIKDRGRVAVGNRADVIIFKGTDVRETIINGKRAIINGKIADDSPGEVLKSGK